MILAESLGNQFTISNGTFVSADPFYEEIFNMISDPVPGPSEGDPDMVYFKRMKRALVIANVVKYVPMIIDETVVY